ncbi:Transglutaminase-like enzyme, putative cysteine protease [Jatrophihabitans endophyticus]|uniref:Transglutaminase-like enzyme, putative cysteine protease n=1 Tax=Jatrophihabitans endophyticus TaxID=1206085 RepID=A0A1M5L8S7_9ACTN|nr:transglutaminaseTgpA domain-containing protein [Jatrophihabitans endophyticus]SHG61149.1 Transglutaminase-like enzyme, putative cysteine protease [Jatrophihabitans endophyticus]
MTGTATRGSAARGTGIRGSAARGSGTAPRRSADGQSAVRRTLLALLAAALGVIPLKALLADSGWLLDVWVAMAVVVGPAALLRLRRPPGALDIWPGVVLLVPWLTLRFLHEGALAGVIPTGATWTQLSTLLTQLHQTTRDEVAPIHSTPAVRLVLCALVGLFAALVDLIAVVGRRGALAGVPLLIVFTVAGAVPRSPVSWVWFVFSAIGYLVLLAVDAGDDLERWGRRLRAGPVAGGVGRTRRARAASGPAIAVAAVVLAVALPALVPGEPRNLLTDAFHGGGGKGVGGFGNGGSNGRISPFAALKGQLDQDDPRPLADVQMQDGAGSPAPDAKPYYLRVNVLSNYTGEGWRVGYHGEQVSVSDDDYPLGEGGESESTTLRARIDISAMRGNAPVFGNPTSISGLPGGATWSPQDQLLLGESIDEGLAYTESFQQPTPSVAQLRRATGSPDGRFRTELALPDDLPRYARNLVADQTAGRSGPYEKARAISDFFADPANGFVYDLKTAVGDSGSDLVDFLQNRRGYCQQYAAAMAVMLRVAGIPARVVLGYMHSTPDREGRFTVTTSDAHSWVEAWFAGIGWVPFDPTPAAGLSSGANSLPYAPRESQSAGTGADDTVGRSSSAAASSTASGSSAASSSSSAATAQRRPPGAASGTPWWVGGGVLLAALLALTPAAVRRSRRQRRYAAARRRGDASALWAELSDTAVDLGYVWSPARSPRQVAAWLARDAPASAESLRALAGAVERQRYAGATATRSAPDTDAADAALRHAVAELRGHRSGGTRFRARFLPASLGWTALFGGPARRRR